MQIIVNYRIVNIFHAYFLVSIIIMSIIIIFSELIIIITQNLLFSNSTTIIIQIVIIFVFSSLSYSKFFGKIISMRKIDSGQ